MSPDVPVFESSKSDPFSPNILLLSSAKLPKMTETEVYRVIQEALNNILKHAHATYVFVKIVEDQNHINVIIQDNGRGFDYESLENDQSLGLKLIRERTEMLGGNFEVDSATGKGTRVTFSLPLQK